MKDKYKFHITNDEILFAHPTEKNRIRRRVPIKVLAGMSKKLEEHSKSLVIHIYGQADEFFYTNDRDDIMDLIKRIYAYKMQKNLPIFAPSESKLNEYCTTDKEAKEGLTRMPHKSTALAAEAIILDYESTENDTDDSNYVSYQILRKIMSFNRLTLIYSKIINSTKLRKECRLE